MGHGTMTLMDRLRDSLGGTDEEADVLYRYHCAECNNEFETPEVSTSQVECPACGASGARSIQSL